MTPIAYASSGLLACAFLAACGGPALASESNGMPDTGAEGPVRVLVDEVLRKAADNDADGLGTWTRSVIDRALGHAGRDARVTADRTAPDEGGAASAKPLPAEHRAALTGLSAKGNSAEAIVFMSLSVPAASWKQWAQESARAGVPLVLRGAGPEGLRGTVRTVGDRLAGHDAGVTVDPRLLRLFGITRVPAVAAVPSGIPACTSRGCSGEAPPPHDLVTGNIGLAAALEAIAAEGDAGQEVAQRHLQRLREGDR